MKIIRPVCELWVLSLWLMFLIPLAGSSGPEQEARHKTETMKGYPSTSFYTDPKSRIAWSSNKFKLLDSKEVTSKSREFSQDTWTPLTSLLLLSQMTSRMVSIASSLPSVTKEKDDVTFPPSTNCCSSKSVISTAFSSHWDALLHTSVSTNICCNETLLLSSTEVTLERGFKACNFENGLESSHQFQCISSSVLENTNNPQNFLSFQSTQTNILSLSSVTGQNLGIQPSLLATPVLSSLTQESRTVMLLDSSLIYHEYDTILSTSRFYETLLDSSFHSQYPSSLLYTYGDEKPTFHTVVYVSPESMMSPTVSFRSLPTSVSSNTSYSHNVVSVDIFTHPETSSSLLKPFAVKSFTISTSSVALTATTLRSSPPLYDGSSDIELKTQTFSPQIQCRTSLGRNLYKNAKEEGSENLLHRCWDILCSEDYPMIYSSHVEQRKTYWFEKSTQACYDSLWPADGMDYSGLSIKANIDQNFSFIILKPSCVQSKGFSYIENIQANFPFLPFSCRIYLCQAGADLLYYGGIPAVLIQPSVLNGENLSSCITDLHKKYNHDNSFKPGSVSVYSFEKYPLEFPCPTTVVFRVHESGTHLIIPYRASWCPPLSRDTWHDMFLSFYLLFQRGEGYRFFKCLRDKSRRWEYHTNRYTSLFEYLLKRNITFPELPESCVDYVCDDEVEITHISQPGDEKETFWLSYVKNCSKTGCTSLASKVLQCQEQASGTDIKDVADIYYPSRNEMRDYFLYLTMSWSCPNGNGEGGEGQLRAEASANLWLKSPTASFACSELLCTAAVERRIKNEIIVHLVDHNKTVDAAACYKYASPTDYYSSEIIKIFSFSVNETENKILFIITGEDFDTKSLGLLGSLYSRSKLELTRCCDRFPLGISAYNFNGIMYYSCYNSNISLKFPNCLVANDMWSVIKVKEELSLVLFRQGEFSEHLRRFFEWLASMDAKLSITSKELFLNSFPYGIHVMLNNVIFIFKFEDNRHPGFITFLSDLQKTDFHCITSSYFTVCSNGSSIFPNSWHTKGYLFIIHKCSVTVSDKDKIVLLLLTQFQDTGFTVDYLCQNSTIVVIVQAPSHQVTYTTSGSTLESEKVLQMLKTASPSWMWKRDVIIKPWSTLISKGWCVHINDPKYIEHYLGLGACIYYSKNNVSIFLQTPSRLYHIDVFPLTVENKSNVILSVAGLKGLIKRHKTVIAASSDVHSSKEILLHTLQRAPVYPELTQFYSQNEAGTLNSVKVFTQIMIKAILTNNSQCLNDLIQRNFFFYQSDHISIIGPIKKDFTESSCFLSLPIKTIDMLQFYLRHNMTTCNKFWTSCYFNMIITYLTRPPVAIDWDYLPPSCKVKEIILLAISIIITLVTITGNFLVLTVIFRTDLIQDETFLLRTSLAFADLLFGIFPAAWSIFDQISLIFGKVSLQHFDPNSIYAGFRQMSLVQPVGFQQIRFERYGYSVLSCIMFNISANVSLLTLAMMSIETYRGIICSPLSRRQILGGISLTWFIGIALSVLVNRRQDGWSFAGYFDPITKLTTSMGSSAPSVSLVIFYVQVVVLGVAALMILIVTTVALVKFSYRNHKTTQKLTIHSKIRTDKNWKATQTFLLMVALFGVSVIPLVVDVILDLGNTNPIGHFFAWWLFMAGTSWNWALYSARSTKFARELRKLLTRKRTNGEK